MSYIRTISEYYRKRFQLRHDDSGRVVEDCPIIYTNNIKIKNYVDRVNPVVASVKFQSDLNTFER